MRRLFPRWPRGEHHRPWQPRRPRLGLFVLLMSPRIRTRSSLQPRLTLRTALSRPSFTSWLFILSLPLLCVSLP